MLRCASSKVARSRPHTRTAPLVALTLALVIGCHDDVTVLAAPSTPIEPGDGTDGDAEPGEEEPGEELEPVYVVFSTIDTPEGRSSYYVTTSSIEGDVAVDVTRGIELPGHAQLYAPRSGGYVLSGGGEAPTLTRYELAGDGTLSAGPSLSFANLGVGDARSQVLFHDNAKAYFLDYTQLQIVAFNPTTMELSGAYPLDDFQCEEMQTRFGFAVQRDDGYYFTRSCLDPDVTSSGSSLVHLDPATDEVTITHDTRCMGMRVGFLADSGHAYWFSDPQASVEWSTRGIDTPHDCALRLRAGESTFDPDWQLDLTTRTGGVAAVASVPAAGATIWMKVFEASAMPVPMPVSEINWGWQVWRWALLDVESSQSAARDEDAELVVYYGDPIRLDGRSFTPASNADFSETTLLELTPEGIRPRIDVRGELREVVRLR